MKISEKNYFIRFWHNGSNEALALEENLKDDGFHVESILSSVREPRISYNDVLTSGYRDICAAFGVRPVRKKD